MAPFLYVPLLHKKEMQREQLFLNGSYIVTTLILTILLFQAPFTPSGWLIPLALLLLFWLLSIRGKPTMQLLISGELFLLLTGAGTGLHLYDLNIAGVTYDTYMHLLAGYFTTLFLINSYETNQSNHKKKMMKPLLAALLVLGLGLLVEIVEFFEKNHTRGYWQDTVKDLVNDVLGICMALLSRR